MPRFSDWAAQRSMDERPAGPGMSIVTGIARSEVREILFSQRKFVTVDGAEIGVNSSVDS